MTCRYFVFARTYVRPLSFALAHQIRISAFLCGVVVPSIGLSDEDRKNSVYYQQRMRTMKYEDH